jgi:alcohol dehydrogenase YqhD (iron-dependent ADH family)
LENFIFHNPTKLIFGEGQIKHLPEEVLKHGDRVLIVTGKGSVKRSGLFAEAVALLKNKCTIFELEGIDPNPRLDSVREGVRICKDNNVNLVLAIGGGSVVDAAKGIASGALYDGDVWDFYMRKIDVAEALPIGVILTLAATGSEMNGNSVVTNMETHEKKGCPSIHQYPTFSILDPTYTFTVPRADTVNGLVDIMAHVFEQYFSHTKDTPLQDRLCEGILLTVIENAADVLADPEDYVARANILLSGTFALNGLTRMGVIGDWASHGIAHQPSGLYDVPHGAALAIILPHWMRHVLDEGVDKFKQYATKVWKVPESFGDDREIALEGIRRTAKFFELMGAPTSLQEYGIGADVIDMMAERATEAGPLGSYKKLYFDDVKAILTKCI